MQGTRECLGPARSPGSSWPPPHPPAVPAPVPQEYDAAHQHVSNGAHVTEQFHLGMGKQKTSSF